jgi:aminoglycoside phosphotransferase (APT) family kinase protein
MDEQGREMLSFIDGDAGQWPAIWDGEDALTTSARLLRSYHDATTDLVDSNEAWVYAHPDRARHEVICHNDFGAYNIVFKAMQAVGVIDFDLAGPGPRLKDVAYAAYWMTPLSLNSDDMRPFAEADLQAGSRRLQLFCEGYGIAADEALLEMIGEVLRLMGDEVYVRKMVGELATAKLIADGHLLGWRDEAASFQHNRHRLAHSLGLLK